MGTNYVPEAVGSGLQSTTTLNDNFTNIQTALASMLSRDGVAPNAMNADLDMNSNDILNAASITTTSMVLGGVSVTGNENLVQTQFVENVAALIASTYVAGTIVETKGYTAAGDGGGARYLIQSAVDFGGTPDGYGDHTLANGNVAVLQSVGSVNVRQFGATGDGVVDDESAIAAAMLAVEAAGGGKLIFPQGTYLINTSILPADGVEIVGGSWESTEIKASGDFPVFHYPGTISNQLARFKVSDILIRGGGLSNANAHGFKFEWANKPLLKNVQFRSCRHCVDASYTIDIGMDYVFAEGAGSDQNHTGLFLGEIDSVTYGVVDNTQILSNISFRQMSFAGVRVEGSTGMKAINVACLNGDYGWYFGEAPLGANARLIRFLHLTNCFSDTNNLYGWRFAKGAMDKIRDLKMVNCWAGSISGTDAPAVFMNGVERSLIDGGIFALSRSNVFELTSCNDLTINACVGYDYNSSNNFHPAILATSCERLSINDSHFVPKASTTNTAHTIKLEGCTECSVNGGAFEEYAGVELSNTTKTSCIGFAVGAASVPVTETGTSNFNVVGAFVAAVGSTLIGAQTTEFPSAGTTNPRMRIIGGSTAAPAIYWAVSTNSGIFRRGTHGMGYSVNGTVKFAVEDDGTCIIGPHTASGDVAVSGYITVKDQSGVTRKVAVIP